MINIIADAIIISDRDDVIKSFIEKGRRLIEKAQLVRYLMESMVGREEMEDR